MFSWHFYQALFKIFIFFYLSAIVLAKMFEYKRKQYCLFNLANAVL